MSSLCRGHANLLCIVPIFSYVTPKGTALIAFLGGAVTKKGVLRRRRVPQRFRRVRLPSPHRVLEAVCSGRSRRGGQAILFLSFGTMNTLATAVDFTKTSLYISLASIAFNPTAWNIVARNGQSSRMFFRRRRCINFET